MSETIGSENSRTERTPSTILGILVGGIIVGVVDLVYAILVYSPKDPIRIPQAIASGLLGKSSFSGGTETAALGVLLHFVIAFGAATGYVVAARVLPAFFRHTLLAGCAYGGFVYFFMHLVVLPLSAVHHGPTNYLVQTFEFLEHCACVGPPIAYSARYFGRP